MIMMPQQAGNPGELQYLLERISQLEQASTNHAKQADERFRQMVDSAPFMMWMSGEDGLCTFFNRPWLEFRGRSMEEEAGNGWTEGVHPEDMGRVMNTYLNAFSAREPFKMQYRLRRADGIFRQIVDSGVPRFDGDKFLGYMGACVELEAQPNIGGETATWDPDLNVRLTPREQQVLKLVAEGNSTKEIAGILGISFKTADSHRTRIMDKLNIHDTATLVRYAIRRGFIQA